MLATSHAEPLTCFLQHQVVKPAATLLVAVFLALVVWIAVGHMAFVERQIGPLAAPELLGLQVVAPDELVARMFSFPPGEVVMVSQVTDPSPAARAGLRRGDGIVAIEGRSIRSAADIAAAVSRAKLGDLLRLTVVRGGIVQTFLLPLSDPQGG